MSNQSENSNQEYRANLIWELLTRVTHGLNSSTTKLLISASLTAGGVLMSWGWLVATVLAQFRNMASSQIQPIFTISVE